MLLLFCLRLLRLKSVPMAALLATGAFVTESRGNLRLRYFVLSGANVQQDHNEDCF